MVSQNVIDTINYGTGLNFQFQMKIYSIIIFLLIAVVFLYIDYTFLKKDNRASMFILSLGMKIYYWVFFLYTPTLIWQLGVTEDVSFLLYIQTYIYVMGAVLAILVLALYLFERLFKDYLGWEITMDGLKITMNPYEKEGEDGK